LLSVEYAQGFNESLGNITNPVISLGTEYRIIPLLPLRTGIMLAEVIRYDGHSGLDLDFRFLTLDFASDNFGMMFSPKSFNVAIFRNGFEKYEYKYITNGNIQNANGQDDLARLLCTIKIIRVYIC